MQSQTNSAFGRLRFLLAAVALCGGAASGQIASPLIDVDTGQRVLYPSYLTEFDSELYFRGSRPSDGPNTSIWRTDGNGAHLISGTTGLNSAEMASINGRLYFGSSSGLWQYDPASGPSQAPGSASQASVPQELTAYNGKLYFRAFRSNIGVELWTFDGTNQTPIDLFPGAGSSYPQHFIQYNGMLYFNANGTPGQGTELWRTNGTSITEAARIYPNNGSSPENFAIYNHELYFSAYDGVHGRELWRYNGATASLAADIRAGGQYVSSNPNNLVVYKNKLYFSADDGVHGFELWSFDGTRANMVAEINPTPDPGNGDTFLMDSSPSSFAVLNDILYFSADDGVHGRELWSYDGAKTSLVMDINPGAYGSEVSNLFVFNNRLYFSADSSLIPGLREPQPQFFSVIPEPGALLMMPLLALTLMRRRQSGGTAQSI